MLLNALIAAIVIALLSLIGALVFGKRGRMLGAHRYILPVAVGVFLGVVFFELIPETLEMSGELGPFVIAIGFLGFYLLSHFLNTFHHHHHKEHDGDDGCVSQNGARKLLIGDAIHNVADGVIIASAFLVNPAVGVATTIGIALHEIPQEIAEFGVLIHAGYSRKRAIFLNLLSASTVIVGVLLTALFLEQLEGWLFVLTGIAAGNLLYIATADLIPELRETHKHHFWQTFIATIIGFVLIGAILEYAHENFGEGGHDEESTEVEEV